MGSVYCWVVYWKTADLSKWNVMEFYPSRRVTLKHVQAFYDSQVTQRFMGKPKKRKQFVIHT